jgi:RimJ/RimL family protein N-acetyltransferase
MLRGRTIRLTALSKRDISTLVQWDEDAGFLRLLDSSPARPRTEEAIRVWLDQLDTTNNEMMFAIRPIDSETLIGTVGFDGIEWSHQVAGFAIGIGDRENQGKGYGLEATRLALAFAFNELNLHRLQLSVFEYNERAIALYERCGFRREGVFREYLNRDGLRHDMYLYGLLRHEWAAGLSD